LKQLVIDAGPLIGFFYAKDTDHQQCVAGITQLIQAKTRILTPLPIVFEVYKWMLQRTNPTVAHQALKAMQASLHFVPLEAEIFEQLQILILSLPNWQGSLEDATVAIIGLAYHCPVWTLNYRDFSIFSNLDFWNPS
jgi:predicted nucleic acid-binding protein